MKNYEELWNEQMKRAEFHMTMAKALLFASKKITTKYLERKRKRYEELEEEKILRMKWNNELE